MRCAPPASGLVARYRLAVTGRCAGACTGILQYAHQPGRFEPQRAEFRGRCPAERVARLAAAQIVGVQRGGPGEAVVQPDLVLDPLRRHRCSPPPAPVPRPESHARAPRPIPWPGRRRQARRSGPGHRQEPVPETLDGAQQDLLATGEDGRHPQVEGAVRAVPRDVACRRHRGVLSVPPGRPAVAPWPGLLSAGTRDHSSAGAPMASLRFPYDYDIVLVPVSQWDRRYGRIRRTVGTRAARGLPGLRAVSPAPICRSCARSAWLSRSRRPIAAQLARNCSGLVAPNRTLVTAGLVSGKASASAAAVVCSRRGQAGESCRRQRRGDPGVGQRARCPAGRGAGQVFAAEHAAFQAERGDDTGAGHLERLRHGVVFDRRPPDQTVGQLSGAGRGDTHARGDPPPRRTDRPAS